VLDDRLMTRPTARVLALLEILQAGGTRTVGDLAARLAVDERTVRRYATHLIDLGIPVRSIRGRYGGYRLAPGYRMPPLMLTEDEAVAVALGLVAGRRTGLTGSSVAASESATAKLRRALPAALAARLGVLLDTAEFTPGAPPATAAATDILLSIARAADEHRSVTITYTSTGNRRSERTVNPFGIVSHAGRWYVIGDDSASSSTRVFRLDRISDLQLLESTFEAREDFDAPAEVLSALAKTPYRHRISLRVNGSAEDVRRRFPPVLATVQDGDEEGWARVRINAERLDWVPAVLARLGVPFVIEKPAALRDLVRSLAADLAAAAEPVQS
jgi:predicted DNA-binding transcriptional regulator YafY